MAVGTTFYKFDQDGNVKPYYGNTIISFIKDETSEVYRNTYTIQKALKESGFADCLAFLPPSSYHMTVLQMCRYIDKGTDLWPKYIDENTPYSKIDPILKARVEQTPFPEKIVMKLEECNETKILARPYDERSERLIREYRNKVMADTGIYHPGYETYRFHVSYAYHVREFTDAQRKEKEELCARMTRELLKDSEPFELTPAKFCIFNDMLAFETDLSKRGDLW